MLNAETKRKIQGLRDTLVGKISVPTDQVKQITLGLIYKFMSDIDRENTDILGGKSFFSGDYERYSWNNIIDKSLSSYERVTLYSEGLEKMSLNSNIPELFRDIFKNAYIPFRDPATLSQFLIGINEFTYDHSEDLGDSFEFLLSIMGSQGAAGQFRTPRHIIDFIVKVVEPKKTDSILDPACGTAGFLISAYKYILENNKTSDSDKPGSALNLTEKNKLTDNFVGYDISTDMVRLSLVNMYLHNFANPNIKEYDTLTNEELWDEDFDCIMANPPFMTPKGGIRPHKRFAIRANRSEVLFVDYIAEHLMPNGKAGVIVPEGIIFQSSNAYKNLRKMLVDENYLYAVVSLPAGVFQPYSGVKTSILFMDKILANKIDDILFVKIENDGFDLGAQRREIDKNDLPLATEIILKYKKSLIKNEELHLKETEKNILNIVKKGKIKESGDYNLTGDRYKENILSNNQKWPFVEVSKIFQEIKNGINVKQFNEKGKYYVSRIESISNWSFNLNKTKYTNDEVNENYFLKEGDILLSHINSIEHLAKSAIFANINKPVIHGINLIKFRPNKNFINPFYAYFIFRSEQFISIAKNFAQRAVNQASLKVSDLKNIKIPLPPLEIQQEIIRELNEYQKIIDGARQVVESYKIKINIKPNWPVYKLKEICIVNKNTIDPGKEYGNKEFFYIDISSIENGTGNILQIKKIKGIDAPKRARRKVQNYDILLSTVRPNLKAFTFLTNISENYVASTGFAVITPLSEVNSKYIYYILFTEFIAEQMLKKMGKGSYPSINQNDVNNLLVPVPSIEFQNKIVNEIDEELAIINENKKLLNIYQKKIKEKVSEIWG